MAGKTIRPPDFCCEFADRVILQSAICNPQSITFGYLAEIAAAAGQNALSFILDLINKSTPREFSRNQEGNAALWSGHESLANVLKIASAQSDHNIVKRTLRRDFQFNRHIFRRDSDLTRSNTDLPRNDLRLRNLWRQGGGLRIWVSAWRRIRVLRRAFLSNERIRRLWITCGVVNAGDVRRWGLGRGILLGGIRLARRIRRAGSLRGRRRRRERRAADQAGRPVLIINHQNPGAVLDRSFVHRKALFTVRLKRNLLRCDVLLILIVA